MSPRDTDLDALLRAIDADVGAALRDADVGDPVTRCSEATQVATRAVPLDVPRATYSVEEYVALWEGENGRAMTPRERETLACGCIGITALNIGLGESQMNPPLNESYATFVDAQRRASELERESGLEARIFSMRFHAGKKRYATDPESGKVDMSAYDYQGKPGFVNFDYGLYDADAECWWHANHGEPGMHIYRSTRKYFSRSLMDFDDQVFCVALVEPRRPRSGAANGGGDGS